jgi:hypothetical protein
VNTGEVAYVPAAAGSTPEALHIFADEGHVHLQNGKGARAPLVAVCEGKTPVCEGRNALAGPFHIHGYGMEPVDLWGYTYALCAEKYDMDIVKEVYIYGDGGAWIKGCFDVFPGAIYVLDEFHLKKRLRGLFAGEFGTPFGLNARAAIGRNDRGGFDRAAQAAVGAIEGNMLPGRGREKKIQKAKENARYILSHWEAIQNIRLPGSVGSCTEAMVSHVLSERFSRSPMGWSEAGLSKMATIRVFVLNGGRIMPADVTAWKRGKKKYSVIAKLEKYEKIIKDQQDRILKDAKNWRWFEAENLISGKRSGTSVALDALAQRRKIS